MPSIELKNITVELPIYGSQNMNLKSRTLKFIAGRDSNIETIRALSNVSLAVGDGDRIGIIGPNGAGKTTLLRVMAGILQPSYGDVTITGSIVSMIDHSLGMDLQNSGFENILSRGIYLGQKVQTMKILADEIVSFSGLGARIHHPLHTYSSGMRARLAFSIATSIKPEILVIDEGLNTADSEFTARAAERLKELYFSTGILLLASHNMTQIREFCTQVIKMPDVIIERI